MNPIDTDEKRYSALSIKDFPADLKKALKQEALDRDYRSVRAYIISILINRPLVNKE